MIASDDERKLFVAGLSEGTNEASLRQVFAEAGVDVEHVSMPRDRMTGRLRGFAFITLRDAAQVERAVSQLDGLFVGDNNLSVRRFNAERPQRGERPAGGPGGPGGGGGGPRGQDNSDRTLFVGNLPYDATQEELEGLLRDAGVEPVVRVFMPLDAEGRRRGFGFVTMGSPEAAANAVQALQGAAMRGRGLVVNAAQPRAAGPRPERSFNGPPGPGPGPGPGGPGGPPSAAAGNRFGPPAKPGGGKNDYGKKRKVEGLANGGRGGRGAKRGNEERWRDYED